MIAVLHCSECGTLFEAKGHRSRGVTCSTECSSRRAIRSQKEFRPPAKRTRANAAVFQALKSGALVRPEACERCYSLCKPVGHHADYDKPLEVEWLCRTCHTRLHAGVKMHWRRRVLDWQRGALVCAMKKADGDLERAAQDLGIRSLKLARLLSRHRIYLEAIDKWNGKESGKGA